MNGRNLFSYNPQFILIILWDEQQYQSEKGMRREDHYSVPQAYHIHRVTPSSSSSSFPVSPSSGPGLLESGGVMGGGCP